MNHKRAELESLVVSGVVKSLSVDTNIFIKNGMDLESGLLAQLSQFSSGPIKFVISDVVKEELLVHLKESTSKAWNITYKSFENALRHNLVDASSFTDLRKNLADKSQIDSIVLERLDRFSEKTGMMVVGGHYLPSTKLLLEMYFAHTSPFESSGKKRKEFPDAIALVTLENWATSEGEKMLVISDDIGWKDYCSKSEQLILVNDLEEALSLVQVGTKAFQICHDLSQQYREHGILDLNEEISKCLDRHWWSTTIVTWAAADFPIESNGIDLTVESFELVEDEETEPLFRPLRLENDTLTVTTKIRMHAHASVEFYLYVPDAENKEQLIFENLRKEQPVDLDLELMIEFQGEFDQISSGVDVSHVQVIQKLTEIDFGRIEPDW